MLPTVILPGYLESAIAYLTLEKFLQQQGFPTVTVPLRRRDWLPTVGGRSMIPILRQLDRVVKEMLAKYGTSQINLIGHSAGGWISRIYLGEKPYVIHGDVMEDANLWFAHPYIASLTTLGTPHTSLERWTRKNLDFVNHGYPGAFYANVRYVCVAGKSVFGQRRRGSWLAYSSYKLTCGVGNTWGDGITPINAAHLEGANNLIIEGVKHSPRSPGIWYGSPVVAPEWVQYLL
ncbi:esterase/lipase family protein [Merismopedia glauca]|uniref:Lipase n=1 Tax=Merismopedia glauca CCAP 1448/3 TaxID=1296344 RepID=A0A2T1C4B9_9CYAN|nr:alpha/beta hydrolase [Merismopedia glauca]PSB03091.1 lipase [Merismopedia glauca CCAP 1448/3]